MGVAVPNSRILTLSIPPGLLRQAERIAKEEGRSKSEIFREALRRYVEECRFVRRVGGPALPEQGDRLLRGCQTLQMKAR